MTPPLQTALLPRAGTRPIGELSRHVESVPSSTRSDAVDAALRQNPDIRCLVICDGDGRLGLVSRSDFQQRMAGPLGFGRLVLGRRPVGELTDWEPVVVSDQADVADVAGRVLDRRGTAEVSDVLVAAPDGSVRHVPVRDLFQALAGQYAARAVTDPLTGLANRDLFLDALDRSCAQVRSGAARVAVLYVDLDEFKAVNDVYGHAVGDEALRAVAGRLRATFRAEDLIARLGGDEFAVLMTLELGEVAALATASALAGRALAALGEPMRLDGALTPGRASIGLAVSSGDEADGETLLREADLAMYRAKASGGGAVEVVQDVGGPLSGGRHGRPPDRERLLLALAEGEFVLHYQPIVHVHSGRLASLEALVRWAHPEHGLLGPAAFLAGVDDAGLSVELGAYVLREACAQLSRWRTALGPDAPPRVNANLSVRQLLDPTLVPTVLAVLAEFDLAPEALRLELPEVATLAQMQQAATALAELRAAGVAITLDDLGAGASSLTHLTRVSLDGIKIDRQFVAGMLEDGRDMAVVRMLLELAHAMGLAVTAEGVETEEQLAALRELSSGRAAYLQGFLVSRPVPAAQLPLPWSAGLENLRSLYAVPAERRTS